MAAAAALTLLLASIICSVSLSVALFLLICFSSSGMEQVGQAVLLFRRPLGISLALGCKKSFINFATSATVS